MSPQQPIQQQFAAHFGSPPDLVAQAPGRVNLIGEHTDYNEGFVLPCAINYQTHVAAQRRTDSQIVVIAADYDDQISQFDLTAEIARDPVAPWSNYIRGVALGLLKQGHALCGANLLLTSTIPQAAGLSSSAALEVAVGLAMSHLSQLDLPLETIARNGQWAENQFVGVNSGIMDQFISALGQPQHALLLDCRDLRYQPVPIPSAMALVIVNSHLKRGLLESAYNQRRQQCEAAARHFGVSALRDVSVERFEQQAHGLPAVVRRRARHVITENQRTLAAADALRTGNLTHLGDLLAASHTSMRDDFEITVPPIDALVDIIKTVIGDFGGVRMTGGGFGGCLVVLTPPALVSAIEGAVAAHYPAVSNGLTATCYLCQPAAGASLVSQ